MDPERVRDTTVYLGFDRHGTIATATSTSGWAWKYPGRLGDSPIIGAGSYADSAHGAAACTHTGEMTIRAGTARAIVLYLKMGLPLEAALDEAIADLGRLRGGQLAGVVIHAMDRRGQHRVVAVNCPDEIAYWIWSEGMEEPELRPAEHRRT
jgi:L-asparaginase